MEGVKIDTRDIAIASYIIDLKISNILKTAEGKNYNEVKDEILFLRNEKMKVYKNNQQTINKVITQYVKDVKL